MGLSRIADPGSPVLVLRFRGAWQEPGDTRRSDPWTIHRPGRARASPGLLTPQWFKVSMDPGLEETLRRVGKPRG